MNSSTADQSIKIWEFPGGIHPTENKIQSTQLPLGNLPIPPQLIIALNQHIGAPAKAIVNLGDKVLAGQLIAAANGTFSANIHASSSGIISAIGNFPIPHPSGISSECITIATDGKHEFTAMEPCTDFTRCDPLDLINKIHAAGMAGLGGAGFPTAVKLNVKSTQQIDTLIINGAECEPYITADDMLMQTRADEVVAGAFLLSHILNNPDRVVIAVEDNKPKAIHALRTALITYSEHKSPQAAVLKIISVPTKYPSGGAKQLTQIITGREIPHGHHSADINSSCINVATAVAAWRAVRFGEPLISRITTVVGESLDTQRNIDVLIGTPIDYVLQHHGFDFAKASRVIMGGSMMGFTLHDLRAPIIKTSNCILAPGKKEAPLPPPAQACIRCGLCSEACPASLLPQQLFWYAQAEDIDRLHAHHLFDCIECGACSYVCPSKIPLVQYYRGAKGIIRQRVADKEKADRSRQRFEFRQSRIEKEEAEKEAKRVARKKAADEVKQKMAAQQSAAANNSIQDHDKNPVVASQVAALITAVAKANSDILSFEEQKARLERLVGAAKNSLESARAPLVPKNPDFPITEEQLVRQQSRIKQTELKFAEAEKKLAEFLATKNDQSTENNIIATIARAQTKLSLSPAEKLQANLESLQARLIKAQEKAEQAQAEGSPSTPALQLGVTKMQEKIAEVKKELADLEKFSVPASPTQAEQNAAQQALAKAKARAASLANMSDDEKRADQIQTMQARLQKAKDRLTRAEAENDVNIEAFRKAVSNIEEKLRELI